MSTTITFAQNQPVYVNKKLRGPRPEFLLQVE